MYINTTSAYHCKYGGNVDEIYGNEIYGNLIYDNEIIL